MHNNFLHLTFIISNICILSIKVKRKTSLFFLYLYIQVYVEMYTIFLYLYYILCISIYKRGLCSSQTMWQGGFELCSLEATHVNCGFSSHRYINLKELELSKFLHWILPPIHTLNVDFKCAGAKSAWLWKSCGIPFCSFSLKLLLTSSQLTNKDF